MPKQIPHLLVDEQIHREVKAIAASRGLKLKTVTEQLLEQAIAQYKNEKVAA